MTAGEAEAEAEAEAAAVERLIALEGAVNFRDLGGYAADGGMRTRWRASCSGRTGWAS